MYNTSNCPFCLWKGKRRQARDKHLMRFISGEHSHLHATTIEGMAYHDGGLIRELDELKKLDEQELLQACKFNEIHQPAVKGESKADICCVRSDTRRYTANTHMKFLERKLTR